MPFDGACFLFGHMEQKLYLRNIVNNIVDIFVYPVKWYIIENNI